MRLVLNGNINRTYVQTLCMMFFHGEKFPLNEIDGDKSLKVSVKETEKGIYCDCEMTYNGKSASYSTFAEFNGNKRERTSKIAIGRAVYLVGKQITGRGVDWGILTGIRPSKVAYELYAQHGYDRAREILCNDYLLNEKKASLALDVAINEHSILDNYNSNCCSVYISIPFCPTRCAYCSYVSYATKKLFDLIPEYLTRIIAEADEKIKIINKLGLKIVTVYIGGGTPTTLTHSQLEFLLDNLSKKIDFSKLDEFTVECGRPDTITKEKLDVLKKFGVKRISVNPQTLNDKVLVNIGRHHTVEDFFKSFELVKNEGFEGVNTDLIAGLDGDSEESFKSTIDNIVGLSPDNVTVHSFSVKKSAQILRECADIYELSGDVAKKSVDYSYKALIENGYVPYYMYRQKNTIADLENVGYSKKGKFGIYNVLMMSDSHTVFGIGAGVTTKLVKDCNGKTEIFRIFSKKYPYEYLQNNESDIEQITSFFNTES